MKLSKKHLPIGIVCLISAILCNIPGVSVIVPYLAFCLCSFFIGLRNKKAFGIIIILLFGLVGLPVFEFVYTNLTVLLFEFVYTKLTVPLATTLLLDVVILLVQTCVYFGLFILVNSWIRKENISFSLTTGVLTISCIVVYSVLEVLQAFAFFNAMNQAIEQNTLIDWLNVMDSGNLFVSIISGIVFYVALWCVSVRFVKEN